MLPVKGNQEALHREIELTFGAAAALDYEGVDSDSYETEERGHGRQERRIYIVIYNLALVGEGPEWAGLKAVCPCIRERVVDGKLSTEEHYFISSRRLTAKELAATVRGHWCIENNLHWQLDVTFAEDANRTADRNAVQNLAVFRRQALALLKRNPAKLSIAKKRFKATLSTAFIEKVLQLG